MVTKVMMEYDVTLLLYKSRHVHVANSESRLLIILLFLLLYLIDR